MSTLVHAMPLLVCHYLVLCVVMCVIALMEPQHITDRRMQDADPLLEETSPAARARSVLQSALQWREAQGEFARMEITGSSVRTPGPVLRLRSGGVSPGSSPVLPSTDLRRNVTRRRSNERARDSVGSTSVPVNRLLSRRSLGRSIDVTYADEIKVSRPEAGKDEANPDLRELFDALASSHAGNRNSPSINGRQRDGPTNKVLISSPDFIRKQIPSLDDNPDLHRLLTDKWMIKKTIEEDIDVAIATEAIEEYHVLVQQHHDVNEDMFRLLKDAIPSPSSSSGSGFESHPTPEKGCFTIWLEYDGDAVATIVSTCTSVLDLVDEAAVIIEARGGFADPNHIRLQHEGLSLDVTKLLSTYYVLPEDSIAILVAESSQPLSATAPTMPRDIFPSHRGSVSMSAKTTSSLPVGIHTGPVRNGIVESGRSSSVYFQAPAFQGPNEQRTLPAPDRAPSQTTVFTVSPAGHRRLRNGSTIVQSMTQMPAVEPVFYGVRRGFQVGVYDSWAELQHQIHGFSSPEFSTFSSWIAAKQYVLEGMWRDMPTAARPYALSPQPLAPNVTKGIGEVSNMGSTVSVSRSQDKIKQTFKCPRFSGNAKDWKAWNKGFLRFLSIWDLEHVLDPSFFDELPLSSQKVSDNKLVYYVLEDATQLSPLAASYVRQSPVQNGFEAYYTLHDGFVFAAATSSTLLLNELANFRFKSDETPTALIMRLEELLQDLEMLPNGAAVLFNDTQRIGYLLGALRHEPEWATVASSITSSQIKGDATFRQACDELRFRCEAERAYDIIDKELKSKRKVPVLGAKIEEELDEDAVESITKALVSSVAKRLNKNDDAKKREDKRKFTCLAMGCTTKTAFPLCGLHYHSMVSGKTSNLELGSGMGMAAYNVTTKLIDYPNTVPKDRLPSTRTKESSAKQ